jgi:hypothetical protein
MKIHLKFLGCELQINGIGMLLALLSAILLFCAALKELFFPRP